MGQCGAVVVVVESGAVVVVVESGAVVVDLSAERSAVSESFRWRSSAV
jgi:hypothetical protein